MACFDSSSGIECLKSLFISGLIETSRLHTTLGEFGRNKEKINVFGEMAMTMDLQSEEILINHMKESGLSFNVFSEEHGHFYIGENPQYTLVIDGLDGSGEYADIPVKPSSYGTMASILYGGESSKYRDYLICGIMIHEPKQLFIATKDRGLEIIDPDTRIAVQGSKRNDKASNISVVVDLDLNWTFYDNLVKSMTATKQMSFQCLFKSQAARTILFLNREIDMAFEWTRKGNLEQPTTYGLVNELGGVMMVKKPDDNAFDDLGDEIFQSDKLKTTHIPILIAHKFDDIAQACKLIDFNKGTLI